VGAEAVILTPALGFAILRVLTLLLLPVLPLAAVRSLTFVVPPPRSAWVALLEVAAVVVGVMLAPLLLLASTSDHILYPREIFQPDGPWDLSFFQFLALRVLPLLYSPITLLGLLLSGEASPDVLRGTLLVGAAIAAVVLAPAALQRDRTGSGEGLRNLLLVLWAAYATIYTVALLLWLANMLNFWCFLVLFGLTLLIHD